MHILKTTLFISMVALNLPACLTDAGAPEPGQLSSNEGSGLATDWLTRDGYDTNNSIAFMTCNPQNLKEGDVANCSVQIPSTVVNNIPNRDDGQLYDVTYKTRPPTTGRTENLAVEFVDEPSSTGGGTWQIQIRATGDAYVGPVTSSGLQVPGPVFLNAIGDYVSHKLASGN
jgi:hypothetical protein